MKVFWALVAVLVITTGVLWVRPGGKVTPPSRDAGESRAQPSARNEAPAPAPTPRQAAAQPAPYPTPPPSEPRQVATAPPTEAESDDADASPFGTTPPLSLDDLEGAAPDAPRPIAQAPRQPAELPEVLQDMASEALTTPAAPAPAAGPDVPEAVASGAPEGAPAPSKIEHKPDGTIVVNDRWIIKGEGTKARPYEVTWDFLISAQETYKPRLGQNTLPEYLSLVNGKWVKISGYIAFPLMAETAEEMLMMLNQWDGCCIGIPPTPYDAIEVRLAEAAEGETRFKVAGTITGKLAVDPYLVRDWLIGLYTMDDAILTGAH